MLEENSETILAEQFERFLGFHVPADQAPADLQADLRLAEHLMKMNLSTESQVHDRLRAQLAQKIQGEYRIRHGIGRRSARSQFLLGATVAVLVILFLISNSPALIALERCFGWITANQTHPAPTQVLTLADNTPTHTRTAALPLHLPPQGLVQSPTPGINQTTPDSPMVIPTPGTEPQP